MNDPAPLMPLNWITLNAEDAEHAWLELNAWVTWLRTTYGLSAAIVPPAWHRHPELVWEFSALHTYWQAAFHPHQDATAPLRWHEDFVQARLRLQHWVAASGTKLTRDRPTPDAVWPPDTAVPIKDIAISHRDQDFVDFVNDDITARS